MKLQNVVLIGLLLLVPVATLSAQNSVPNPNDDSCWSSLSALRACQLQAYNQAQDYAQRCTSYPEYQCFDYYQPQQKASKTATKANSNSGSTVPANAAGSQAATDSITATSGAN